MFSNKAYCLGATMLLFIVACKANGLDKSTDLPSSPSEVSSNEDYVESYFEKENSDEDELKNELDMLKRSALPKLRRIFIGKRYSPNEDMVEPVEWLSAKRSPPRRHLFIGKRAEQRSLNKKSGRVHRIFIG